MVDNQGTDTPQSANDMFDESVFTDAPQTEAVESSVDNTMTPSDAFTEQSGECRKNLVCKIQNGP